MLYPLAVCLALFVVYKLVVTIQRAYFTPLSKIPGPWYAKFTNLYIKIATISGTRTDYIHALHQRYGPVVRIEPGEVAVADLAAIKQIHRIGGGFLKADMYRSLNTTAPDGPPGLFSSTDAKHHAGRRRLMARGFSQAQLRDQWESMAYDKVYLAVQKMKEELAAKGSADVLKWWMFMATDVSAHVMFGDSFHVLEAGKKVAFVKAIEKALVGAILLVEAPLIWRLCNLVPFKTFTDIFHANEVIHEQGKRAMQNVRASQHTSNIFDQIAAQSEKGDERLTEEEVTTEAANMIFAGTDTTANTATYMVWALLCHPSARQALEAELDTVERPFTDVKLEKLPVLDAVVEETLRLYCAAPFSLPRKVPEGGATLGGYFVPGGETVSTQAWTPHRQPDLFPDPERFDITRWLDGKVSDAGKHAMAPFGHGSRACIGIHLAKLELRLAAAAFFTECRGVRLAPTTTPESMKVITRFVIAPAGGKCEIVV